jgi:hypothetical protein
LGRAEMNASSVSISETLTASGSDLIVSNIKKSS